MVYQVARRIKHLPASRRRSQLEALFEAGFLSLFAGWVLPLAADRERGGHLPPTLGCQNSAVAIGRGVPIVTVDRRGFAPLGCALLGPTA